MKTYLEALDLWEVVEEDYDILPLSDDPTMNQIRIHKERKTKRQRQSRVYLSVSLKPSSQESWLSNKQKQFGIT